MDRAITSRKHFRGDYLLEAGRAGGRPPKLKSLQRQEIIRLVKRGRGTAADAGRLPWCTARALSHGECDIQFQRRRTFTAVVLIVARLRARERQVSDQLFFMGSRNCSATRDGGTSKSQVLCGLTHDISRHKLGILR